MTDPLLRRKRFILFTGHELPIQKDSNSNHATENDNAHPSLASMLSTEREAAMKSTTIISRAKHKIAADSYPKEIPPQPSFASILSTERESSCERSTIISRALQVMAERETASSKNASLLMLQPSCWEYHRGETGLVGGLHQSNSVPVHHQSGGEDTGQSKKGSSSQRNTEMVQKTFHNHNSNPAHAAYHYPPRRPTAAHKMMETLVDEYQQILLETNDSSHRGAEEDPVVLVQKGSSGAHCCKSLLPKEEEGYHSFGTDESDCGY